MTMRRGIIGGLVTVALLFVLKELFATYVAALHGRPTASQWALAGWGSADE